MNSILLGSLAAACRSAGQNKSVYEGIEGKGECTFTGKLLSNRNTTYFEDNATFWYSDGRKDQSVLRCD
jgi:hypothetical protein